MPSDGTPQNPPSQAPIEERGGTRPVARPVRLGRFEVVAHIATGGMGAVYRATDTETGKTVAVKVLSPELSARPEAVERFRREARNAARLRHDNIVSIYEIGEVG